MTPNEIAARSALRVFYSGLSGLNNPFESYDQMISFYSTSVAYYDDNGNEFPEKNGRVVENLFLENFGSAINILKNKTKTEDAMRKVARYTTKNQVPKPSLFFDAMTNAALTFTVGDFTKSVGQGITQTVGTVAGAAVAGVGAYVLWLIGAALLMGYLATLRKGK